MAFLVNSMIKATYTAEASSSTLKVTSTSDTGTMVGMPLATS
jgi:hypothetical protein